MARPPRVVIPGCPHHVTQRGNQCQNVFFSDEDRQTYLHILSVQSARRGLRVLAFCLMTNHVHLLVIPERQDSLRRGVGLAHQEYARWLHIRQQLTGHVWQGRYYSCPLDQAHLVAALLYVECNPVRSGLVDRAEQWPWSSAAAHRDGLDCWDFLDLAWWRELETGSDPGWWGAVLRSGFGSAALEARIREATRAGRWPPIKAPDSETGIRRRSATAG